MVGKYLDGGSTLEDRQVIGTKRDILRVPVAGPIGVEDVGIFFSDRKNPFGNRNGDGVSNIAPTLMERHNCLNPEPTFFDKVEQFPVRTPIVLFRTFGLDDPPPHVDHDSVDSGLSEQLQLPLQLFLVGELVLFRYNSQLSNVT